MNLRISKILIPAAFLLALSLPACSGNGAEGDGDGDGEAQFPSYCEVTEWECEAFEDGPNLSERRHGHHTVVIDHERVLLIGGSYRPGGDGASQPYEGSEILNPITDEVRETAGFARVRQGPTVVQLKDRSVLAIGGADANLQRKTSMERFDPETETWIWVAPMNIDYRAGNLTPIVLDDGRMFLLRRDDQFGSINPSHIGAEIYDPEEDSWSDVDGFPDMEIETLTGALLPDGNILIVAAEPDDLTKNPPAPPEGQEPRHPGHRINLVVYDVDSQSSEVLGTLSERGHGLTPSVTWLPEREFFLINIYGVDYRDTINDTPDDIKPTVGYLYDPETQFWDQFYEKSPPPGRLITVLPGDRALFYTSEFSQYYDLDTDVWWDFDAFHPGTTYSSIVQLEDCRLFASGERVLTGPDGGELRGVDTAYCTPVEATGGDGDADPDGDGGFGDLDGDPDGDAEVGI